MSCNANICFLNKNSCSKINYYSYSPKNNAERLINIKLLSLVNIHILIKTPNIMSTNFDLIYPGYGIPTQLQIDNYIRIKNEISIAQANADGATVATLEAELISHNYNHPIFKYIPL
jgi:hypothetical protein